MPKTDPAKLWSLNYRLLMSVISSVAPDIAALGLETKELFVLAEIDEHPYPAELAATLCMPRFSITVKPRPSVTLPPPPPRKANYGHYFATRYQDGPAEVAMLCEQQGVRGVLMRRTWSQFEPSAGSYDFGAIDWAEFHNVLKGNGPCNHDRMRARVKAWEDGAWVREAAMAHAEKRAARSARVA